MRRRGGTVKAERLSGHRVPMSTSERGFTLIELVITIIVLTILSLGIIPLVKVSVKRQKEQQLRDALREMRLAIDQFHREALIYNCALQTGGQNQQQQQQQQQLPIDPRIKVAITDCTI